MKLRVAAIVLLSFLIVFTGACGKEPRTLVISKALPTVRGTTNFTGTWAMKLKGTKDGCGLGLKNKSFPGTIIIQQNKKKVSLSIQGIAKTFKGTANGSTLTTTGRYVVSGFVLSGTIGAKLTGARTMKLTTATLVINTGQKSCTVLLSGSGKR